MSRRLWRERAPVLLLAAAAAAAVIGCGARTEYVVQNLAVERTSWDSLRVDVDFARRAVIGGSSPVEADSVIVVLFDADYDTLFTGGAGAVPVPDGRLGDRERIMLEVCGSVKRRHICVQESLRASPKRLDVSQEITYPRQGDLEEGDYDLSFQVLRREFDGENWEPIDAHGISGHLLAWVDDPKAKTEGAVRIPFRDSRGRFNLARQPNYKNFKYYLDSQLLDEDAAAVYFDVYAGLGGNHIHLSSTRKEVRRKDNDQRELEVRYFAEQAAETIIDELGSFLGTDRAYAYVEDWSYNTISRTYEIELEIEWEGSMFDRGRHEIEGMLDVAEDGSSARYRLRDGNRRALRKWRARTDEEVLMLGRLEVYRDDFTAAVAADALL